LTIIKKEAEFLIAEQVYFSASFLWLSCHVFTGSSRALDLRQGADASLVSNS
jgi:hypothetical protein